MKNDIAVVQADKASYDDKLTQVMRFMDRLRASNTYGEPIVRFNEDSATKSEMQDFVNSEAKKLLARLNKYKKQASETEPVIQDIREDMTMLKNIFKKHEGKISTLMGEEPENPIQLKPWEQKSLTMKAKSPRSPLTPLSPKASPKVEPQPQP